MMTYAIIETLLQIKYLQSFAMNFFFIHTSFFIILFYEYNYDT